MYGAYGMAAKSSGYKVSTVLRADGGISTTTTNSAGQVTGGSSTRGRSQKPKPPSEPSVDAGLTLPVVPDEPLVLGMPASQAYMLGGGLLVAGSLAYYLAKK